MADHQDSEKYSPGQHPALPPPSVDTPAPEEMMAAAAEYGIEILGPPGIPDRSR